MHVGAQSRGLRAPCERFAPGVTPGPRITRFRLAADLGRMGLDTHRVSNKVSKITSRPLVPLDRAFPAHALLHESSLARTMPTDRILTGRCDTMSNGHSKFPRCGHPIEDLTPEDDLTSLPGWAPGAKTISDDDRRWVTTAVVTMVPRSADQCLVVSAVHDLESSTHGL